MPVLYHFWSSPPSQRIRLALHYKGIAYEDRPLDYDDDETFFELGVQRSVPVLQLDDGRLLTDSFAILQDIDDLFPDTPPLVTGCIHTEAWQALLTWREKADPILQRLYAPILPAWKDIGADEKTLRAYKQEVQHRFGMSVEDLASDRYAGYEQLERLSHLRALAQHLGKEKFYMGKISIADMVLTADLQPLQQQDGITLPLDLMYYFARVEETCGLHLNDGLLSG